MAKLKTSRAAAKRFKAYENEGIQEPHPYKEVYQEKEKSS